MERRIAKELGGVRHPVTGRGGEFPDVETDRMCIEAKSRANVPAYLQPEHGVLLRLGEFVAMTYKTFSGILRGEKPGATIVVNRKPPMYIKRWFGQAAGFRKIPVLVIHRNKRHYSSDCVVLMYDDFKSMMTGGARDGE